MTNDSSFHVGQSVWVRNLPEILSTLDEDGKLDGLPFMPEMTQYCGRQYRISCLPNKICVEGVGFRNPTQSVFLENLRCDASSHDGCQRECLLFWKAGWLDDQPPTKTPNTSDQPADQGVTLLKSKKGDRYFCQSTELVCATSVYHEKKLGFRGKLRQNLSDVWHGNTSVTDFFRKVVDTILNRLKPLVGIDASGIVHGHRLETELLSLDLQPGDWVEVKNRKEIEDTLDVNGKNRGLLFDPPMLAYCGRQYRVANQLQKMILEETGKMINLRNTVILDNVICRAWNCPRANFHFWREIWLKRIEPPSG